MHTKTGWLTICFNMADEYIPKDVEQYNKGYDSREKFVDISDHVVAITNHYLSSDKTDKERVVYVYLYLGIGYSSIGDYSKSLEWKLKALDLQEGFLDKKHPLTATVYINVANEYSRQGNYVKSLELYERLRYRCILLLCQLVAYQIFLYKLLRFYRGFSVFIGAWDLRPGDDFVTKANEAIRNADVFMPILSEAYAKSVYCTAEFDMAFGKNSTNKLKLILVRVSNVTHTALYRCHFR